MGGGEPGELEVCSGEKRSESHVCEYGSQETGRKECGQG